MKRKLRSHHKLIYEDVLKQVQKEDVAFFSKCTKFSDQVPPHLYLQRALQFLWLKDQKIDRKVALQFGNRRVCKIDSTMKHDGPSSARIIKTKKISEGMVNGWHNGAADPQYDLGPKYNIKKLENDSDQIQYEELIKQDQQKPSDFKVKQDHQEIYNQNLSEKFSLQNLDSEQLYRKLSELKQTNRIRSEQPQEYVEVEGQRFYHILGDIQDYLDKRKSPGSIIEQMRAFQTLYPIKRKLQVKQLHPGDPLGGLNDQDGTHKSQTKDTLDRKRTFTNMKCDQFNTNSYVFNVKEVPNIAQQLRRNQFSQLIEELKENGMMTPKEANDKTPPEHSRKGSAMESQENEVKLERKFYLKFPKQSKVESTQTTAHTKSQRFGTLQSQISQQHYLTAKGSMSNIYGSSLDINLDSPSKRTNRLELRIDRFVKQHIKNQNSVSPTPVVDMTLLRQKYKSLKTEREKEISRMYKSQQIEKINNKTIQNI